MYFLKDNPVFQTLIKFANSPAPVHVFLVKFGKKSKPISRIQNVGGSVGSYTGSKPDQQRIKRKILSILEVLCKGSRNFKSKTAHKRFTLSILEKRLGRREEICSVNIMDNIFLH